MTHSDYKPEIARIQQSCDMERRAGRRVGKRGGDDVDARRDVAHRKRWIVREEARGGGAAVDTDRTMGIEQFMM